MPSAKENHRRNTVQDFCVFVSNQETVAIKSCAQRSMAFNYMGEGILYNGIHLYINLVSHSMEIECYSCAGFFFVFLVMVFQRCFLCVVFLAEVNHKSVKKPGVAMVKRPTATGDLLYLSFCCFRN